MTIPSQSYCFPGIVTLYVFFFVSLVLHTLASPMPHYCRHDQRDALLEFKHEFPVNESSLYFPRLSSWNKSSDCCSWEGVKCDAKSSQVISLDLRYITLNNSLKANSSLFKLHHLHSLALIDCDLYGEIPSSLGNLPHLTWLNLWGNYLVGEVPVSIGNLTKLEYLNLDYNEFTGEFPLVNLTTSLSVLSITHNLFKSTLPPDMSRFHSLKVFDVSVNSFFGSFPTSLFMIPSLTFVSLNNNHFKGPIEFRNTSSSSKLSSLFLEGNKLNGPIPNSISDFPNLEYLDLSHNNFTGLIPRSISKLVNLVTLDLSHNNFTGPIPSSISKLVNLYTLHLSNNNFIGPIPRSKLVNLTDLDFSNNKLEGEIPGWLGGVWNSLLSHNYFSSFGKSFGKSFGVSNLTFIQTLDLSSNSFRGPIPRRICKLRLEWMLDLSYNSFSGSIPQCLRNTIVQLRALNLQNNNFSGILPNVFFDAPNLELVDVSGNQLEGKLPESLINLTSLELLNVGNNRFKDKFPSWLASLPSLNVLILRSNEFYGPLPHVSIGFQSLYVIDISHNHFNGTLPPFYFSNWHEMTTPTERDYPHLGYPTISDKLFHNSMEMVNKGVNTTFEYVPKDFRAIDFSGNKFCGKIPKSIGLLKGLYILNFSGNAFTSNIPQSLANLTKLEALDLSRNQLSGQIPRNLGSLSFLAVMNFSHNNLEGPIPRGTQFLSQNCSAFTGNPKLYGLEDVCGETHVQSPTPQESEDLSEPEEQAISWIAAAIAYGPGVFWGLVIGHIFSPHKHKWFW